MFSIGDFSLLARVSRRLLSRCQIIGLLQPALFDKCSGASYYSAAQLPRLNRIFVLKELGFDFAEIARLIDHVSAAEVRGMLLMQRCEAGRLSSGDTEAALMERLARIEARIFQIEDRLDGSAVSVRAEPARRLLSLRETLSSFARVRASLATIEDCVRQGLVTAALGPLMAVSHSREFELEHMDVELGVIVQQSLDYELRLIDRRVLNTQQLPAVACMAICLRAGLAEHAHLMTARVACFIEANGYRLAGPSREVYLGTMQHTAMQPTVVEMQFPIVQREDELRPALQRIAHVIER